MSGSRAGRAGAGVLGIVQARASSERLPAKILAPIAGLPLIAVLAERVRRARVDSWWLATSDDVSDDVTAAWGDALGLRVYRGDTDDVLSRFAAIVGQEQPDLVVRLTADDPFVDAQVVDDLVEAATAMDPAGAVMAESATARTLPLGYAPQVARAGALLALDRELPAGSPHRSHVLSRLYETGGHRVFTPASELPSRPHLRWTIDLPRDLRMAQAAFELFGPAWPTIGYPKMIEALDARPDITALNAGERQKATAEG